MNKILLFLQKAKPLREKNMFSRTQSQLTKIYSGLLILFLLSFMVIAYLVLYFTILKSSERELQSLAIQEADFIEEYLLVNEKKNFQGIQNQEIVFAGVNQAFYYVLNPKGEVLLGTELNSRLRTELLSLLDGKQAKYNEVFIKTLKVEENLRSKGKPGEFLHGVPKRDLHLMIASRAIHFKGQYVGQLFIGKDISFAYQLFNWFLVVLCVLGILFFGLAIVISHKMSKKAMVPIANAFTRQREFVADASHELRTPLAVLLSSVDAMEMTIEPKENDFARKLLSNMKQEVKRMTNLVSDLLTLARSDSNTVELRVETFDFQPIAKKAIESVSALAEEKAITTSLKAPPILEVIGDPERLSQLLYILLDNAIKYTPNGGQVNLLLSKEGADICIAVQDTGIGIKQEDFNRIFERFYRSDKSRSRQMGGHGLGLSIAKWIVDTHHGTIQIESELGKGSTFIIRVPNAAKEC